MFHNDRAWIARNDTVAGEEPGVDGKWRSLSLLEVWHTARGKFTVADEAADPQPADGNDGDLWFSHATNHLFFKSAGTWNQVQ